MRLNQKQIEIIRKAFSDHFLPQDELWVFGSRVNDEAKGGDIDLYVETGCPSSGEAFQKRISFIVALKRALGDQKIDVVVRCLHSSEHLPIYDEARSKGVKL